MVIPTAIFGQFSPGPLSKYHEALEGNLNCVECHEVGKKEISRDCIVCHEPIEQRIREQRGYHKNLSKNCGDCHSEHNGREFELVYWPKDIREFDHSETGYSLTFKHTDVECKKCHTRELIKAQDIISWAGKYPQYPVLDRTFLGLGTTCVDCHTNIHQGELSNDCISCHSTEDWKQASKKFDHKRAKFQLTGAHIKVSCEKCHPPVQNIQPATMKFTGLKFTNCTPCHNDVHSGSFGTTCENCHTTIDWKKDRKPFDHTTTRYPLIGKHQNVQCSQCHTPAKAGRPLAFVKCTDCHEDVHQGQLALRRDKGECSVCHDVNGFKPSRFTFTMHETARLVLEGAHIAVPCNQCHKTYTTLAGKSDVTLHWSKFNCQTCHEDYHHGQFTERLQGKDCTVCHQTVAWEELVFSHNDSGFPLEGKHARIKCESCHTQKGIDSEKNYEFVIYTKTEKACASCHDDIHQGQFLINRGNQCGECHSSDTWRTLVFNHNTSRFSLKGKHENLKCNQCHVRKQVADGSMLVHYYPIPHQCADCHLMTEDIR